MRISKIKVSYACCHAAKGGDRHSYVFEEHLTIKRDKMHVYFAGEEKAAYYVSTAFGRLLVNYEKTSGMQLIFADMDENH